MNKKLYEQRRAANMCTACGKPLDNYRWVTCISCHDWQKKYHAEHYAIKKAKDLEKSKQPEQKPGLKLHPEICLNCCWSKYDGGTLFCPFAAGTCMRKDQLFRNTFLSREGKR